MSPPTKSGHFYQQRSLISEEGQELYQQNRFPLSSVPSYVASNSLSARKPRSYAFRKPYATNSSLRPSRLHLIIPAVQGISVEICCPNLVCTPNGTKATVLIVELLSLPKGLASSKSRPELVLYNFREYPCRKHPTKQPLY